MVKSIISKWGFPLRGFGQSTGIVALLFSVLLLPLLHLHPEVHHAHGEIEQHRHHARTHADFFPTATHDQQHFHENHGLHLGLSVASSGHTLSEINLSAPHLRESDRLSARLERNQRVFSQVLSPPPKLHQPQKGRPWQKAVFSKESLQFSPTSLRGPPFST